jgi:hypothetical protein
MYHLHIFGGELSYYLGSLLVNSMHFISLKFLLLSLVQIAHMFKHMRLGFENKIRFCT